MVLSRSLTIGSVVGNIGHYLADQHNCKNACSTGLDRVVQPCKFPGREGLLAGIPIMDSAKRVLLKRKELQLLADWLRLGKGRPYHAV